MSIFTYLKVANNTRDLEGILQMFSVTYFGATTLKLPTILEILKEYNKCPLLHILNPLP